MNVKGGFCVPSCKFVAKKEENMTVGNVFFHISTAEQYVPTAGEGKNFPPERREQGAGRKENRGADEARK